MRALVRWAVAMASVALIAGASASVLWAHAHLVRSEPMRDARLAWPPRVILLVFSEAITPATSRVELVAPDSQRFALAVRADSAGNDSALLADVPALPLPGTYRVEWRLIGPDGHAVNGRFGFSVDSIPSLPPVTPAEPSPAPATHLESASPFAPESVLQTGIRFLWLLALVLVFGATTFSRFVLGRLSGDDLSAEFQQAVDLRLRAWVRASAWTLLVLAFARLTIQGAALDGSLGEVRMTDLFTVLSTSWGRGLSLFVLTLVVILALLRRNTARSGSRWQAVTVACVALAVATSFLGHAAGARSETLSVGLDATHALAAGGWAGTVLVLALVVLPNAMLLPSDHRISAMRSVLRVFSPVALSCAAVVVVTGGVAAWLKLGSLPAFLGTPYGMALVRKLVLVMAVATLGAWHWRVVQPTLHHDRAIASLRWSIAIDLLVILGVVALTAVLTGTALPLDLP